MNKVELEERTKVFALKVIAFVSSLQKNKVTDVLIYQLLKAGTSIGANYRESNRAESRNDFIHKIGIVEKEASETCYWLELFEESKIVMPRPLLGYTRKQASFWQFSLPSAKSASCRRLELFFRNPKSLPYTIQPYTASDKAEVLFCRLLSIANVAGS